MPKRTDISIVIPTLNEEKHIRGLLGSLKPQLLGNDEIIIIDSFSKDRTRAIARSAGCRVITVPPEGIAAAKNAGAEKARNDIVAFLDADCAVSERWLAKIRDHLSSGGCSAVAGLDLYASHNRASGIGYNLYSRLVFWAARAIYALGGKPWFPSNNCAMRRKLFMRLRFSNVVCEDVDLMRRWPMSERVRYDASMVVRLSDRRFRKEGFWKTLAGWLVADIKAWNGNGIHAKGYSDVHMDVHGLKKA